MTFTGKFVLVFLSRTFSTHRTAEGERYLFNSSLPPPLDTQTLRHLSGDYCRDLTSTQLAASIYNTYIHSIYIHIYVYIHICIYIYIYIQSFIYIYKYKFTYTLLRKKENALIIHSALETWKYAIIRGFIILSLCLFSKISHPR